MDKQLPTNVIFKGDNGKYLGAVTHPGTDHVYLQFYVEDRVDPRCRHMIIPISDGTIRIKSVYYDMFWRRSPNWIWVHSSDTTSHNPDTLFQPVKIGEATIALKNVGNGNYCKRLTADYKQSCLNADNPHLEREAYLTVEEAVLSRRIYNVEYRLGDAKILDNKVIILDSNGADNRGSKDDTSNIGLKYAITTTRQWDSSVSMKLGVKTTIEAGVPGVASDKVEIESEFTGSYAWGESIETTVEHSTDYEVIVPVNKHVQVTMLATEGTCEVPFSYYQEDVLTTGETVISQHNDGIYRGVNSYNLTTQKTEKDL